jgi:hypothetical protein
MERAFLVRTEDERLGNVGCVIAAVVRYHRLPFRAVPNDTRESTARFSVHREPARSPDAST